MSHHTSGRTRARVLMVQGTSSHAGKSTLVAALCRIFAQDGVRVAPFKAQNMSLNSAVTVDGDEIGRAQMLQAQAARVTATADMNPILLKPQGEKTSQIVVLGRARTVTSVQEYYAMRDELWPTITGALDRLRAEYDLVIIEGAGSPAEINLRDRDMANMRVALHAQAPVLLVGDIERGGVFASLVGTMTLLDDAERALVRGFVINKFRGDVSLIDPGPAMLEARTGVPTLGVLPYLRNLQLPDEDSLGLPSNSSEHAGQQHQLDIAVIRLPHIANFDDFDPLRHDPRVRVRYVSSPAELNDPSLIIIPGSKTTVADLVWLHESGFAQSIIAHRTNGTPILGICGGFQMLGDTIHDPNGIESTHRLTQGLGLLPVSTLFYPAKTTRRVRARAVATQGIFAGCDTGDITGYEIHMGDTITAIHQPLFECTSESSAHSMADGAIDKEGLTAGTYLHGLFHNEHIRRQMLETVAARKGVTLATPSPSYDVDASLDALAAHVRAHLDIARIATWIHAGA